MSVARGDYHRSRHRQVITTRPYAVWWLIGEIHYAMMEVTPAEMKAALKKHPDVIGVPHMFAIIDDDVEWWPQCPDGKPVVVLGQ